MRANGVTRRFVVVLVGISVALVATGAGSANRASIRVASTVVAKSPCVLNVPTDAITGAYGTASAIGWAGNYQGVVTCLGGSFYVQDGIEKRFGFGIYAGGPTQWVDADGYLPAQITTFDRLGTNVAITEFADEVVLGGHPYVAVYSRAAITNETDATVVADPEPTPGLIPLATASDTLAPHSTAVHDYVLAVDRFGTNYPWPSSRALTTAGSFDQHFAHMRAFWEAQLQQIAHVRVPDNQLNDAYRSGFIYTQIARSGDALDTGVNGYETEFSHDVIGILANLFTQGSYNDAHALLLEARNVIGSQPEYVDAVWTYAWPWAIYLLKTGDLSFVKANFAAPGPAGASNQPSIEQTAHQIARDRTGPNGIIGVTGDIDSNGYWTVDDYEALMGLAAYRYLAHEVGDARETRWATNEYHSLLASTNRTLDETIHRYGLHYLPCSMVEPNTANRCANPEDANWAAPLLFGRWAWDAQLFGATMTGPGLQLIDATYAYGFGRLVGKLPPNTFGGYPGDYYSSGYNAGYGSGGLASTHYRSQGIMSYEFMISHTQSGPYSWWESASAPSPNSPWIGSHPATGQGSCPHAWGISNANKVLLDSLVAQATNGVLIVGRGVPDDWTTAGKTISVTNFPTTNGTRLNVTITSEGRSVTLTLSGSVPTGGVLFQLPVFVDNIAATTAGTIMESTGTVRLSEHDKTATVALRQPRAQEAPTAR
jgi:hypothetical protein